MSLNFRGLAGVAIDKICNFSNNETLVEMRQVCKLTKAVVDCLVTVLTNAKCKIRLSEIQHPKREMNVHFMFLKRRDAILWKFWLLSSLTVLKLHTRRSIVMSPNTSFDFCMTVKETVKLWRILHPFVQRNINYTFPYWLTLDRLELSTIIALPSFIIDYYIAHITIDIKELKKPNTDHWLAIIKIMRTKTVGLSQTPSTKESYSFLIQLADIVDQIAIGKVFNSRKPIDILPLSIVKKIFGNRCSCLITGAGTYSLEDAEEMIQFLQHLDRRVCFGASIDDSLSGPMNLVIGEFDLKIVDPNTFRTCYIKHLETPHDPGY